MAPDWNTSNGGKEEPHMESWNNAKKHCKPPLGLKPREIHARGRVFDIVEAMGRYTEDQMLIPDEWIGELIELTEWLKSHERNKPCPGSDDKRENYFS